MATVIENVKTLMKQGQFLSGIDVMREAQELKSLKNHQVILRIEATSDGFILAHVDAIEPSREKGQPSVLIFESLSTLPSKELVLARVIEFIEDLKRRGA